MKKYGKILAAMLAVTISAGTTGIYAMANNDTKSDNNTKNKSEKPSLLDNNSTRETSDEPQAKNETVYVMTDANGNKTKTIVSDWLQNNSGESTISDISELTDIENLRFNGGYSADGSDITWSANGGDIYYKGYSSSDLPVDIKISYTLNGKSITPEDLAGKSGKVTVRYDYINNSKKVVTVNGKKTEMYTPFMMATGVLLDGNKFSNVKAENGKIISDGSRIVVVGCALPGLTESLGLSDNDDINIPEYFEFSADVTDFEMKTTITSGTSSMFSQLDLDDISEIDELKGKIDELADASEKLCSGTSELCTGLETLQSSTGGLTNGVDALVNGDRELDSGINTLANGAVQLSEGVKTLDDGAGTLSSGIESAKSGSDTILGGFKTAQDGMSELKTGTANLSEGLKTADEGAKNVNDGAQALSTGSSQLSTGATELDNGVKAVAQGTSQLASSAVQLDNGADTLSTGVDSAKNGADTLSSGISQAGTGAQALAKGISQAGEGVNTLAEGAAAGAEKIESVTSQIGDAADSLDTTITYNQQVITGLEAMQSAYPEDSEEYKKLAVMIGTLKQTVSGQQEISEGLKNGADSVTNDLTALNSGIAQLKTAFNGDGTENNPGLIAGAAALNAAFTGSDSSKGLTQGASELAGGLGELSTGAAALAEGTESLVSGTAALDAGAQKAAQGSGVLAASGAQLAQGASALAEGTQALSTGISSASEGSGKLYIGAQALETGLGKLSEGEGSLNAGLVKLVDGGHTLKSGTGKLNSSTGDLLSGTETLRDGSGTLLNGLFDLQSGTAKLTDGVNKLTEGSKTLDTGMSKFKKQGVDKITAAYNDELTPLLDRLSKLSELSRDYTNFSGAAKGVDTDVKFIYETAAIK